MLRPVTPADFRIAAAQVPSVRGKVEVNVRTHAAAMAVAADHGVSLVVFPELSLTGYELDLAAELAMSSDDPRLDPLIETAGRHGLEAVVGAPLSNGAGKPGLGAFVIGPGGVAATYRKMHLGGDEPTHFAPGDAPCVRRFGDHAVGLAICADSSKPSHSAGYAAAGAGVYATGVFLTPEWYQTDTPRLAAHAARHRMLVVMANHGASRGSLESVGKSAIWGPDGELLVRATGTASALLVASRTESGWRAERIGLEAEPH
jgi:predicted amidohydrolase